MLHVTKDAAIYFGWFLCVIKPRVMPETKNKTLFGGKGWSGVGAGSWI